MAACRITIQLNDSAPLSGGAPVSGVVIVNADKDVACKGLVVRTIWSTHGRGNVDTGEVASQQLFEGNWQSGQEARYPFTLPTAAWPPTYYGNYLNVSHYVSAQAKLSWAIDPKAQVEYVVVAHDAPDDLKPTVAPAKQSGFLAATVLGLIAVAFMVAFIPLLLLLVVVIGPIAGLVYFFKVILPKRITGPVSCDLAAPKVRAGENVRAKLEFTPARNSTINGIEWKIRCIEECVSGSGSNRRTHTSELFQDTVSSCGTRQLRPGEKQSIEFDYKLPTTAAPSLKFGSNLLKWTITARIDIPSWPDWTKNLEPIVLANATNSLPPRLADDEALGARPSSSSSSSSGSGSFGPGPFAGTVPSNKEKTVGDEAWLSQVVAQIREVQFESDALATVLEAVKDFSFPIAVTLENEIDTPDFFDEEHFQHWDDAEWWTGYSPNLNMDIGLAWEDGYPPEVESGRTWRGQASIVGYSAEQKQLLMCVQTA